MSAANDFIRSEDEEHNQQINNGNNDQDTTQTQYANGECKENNEQDGQDSQQNDQGNQQNEQDNQQNQQQIQQSLDQDDQIQDEFRQLLQDNPNNQIILPIDWTETQITEATIK